MRSEQSIYAGNKMSSHVEAVETFKHVLNSSLCLLLKKHFLCSFFFLETWFLFLGLRILVCLFIFMVLLLN